MPKGWFMRTFFGNRMLLKDILVELRSMHWHLDRLDAFYRLVHKIKEEEEKR